MPPSVQKLLDAGATITGKTVCDEFFYSVAGVNAHYGTPVNPRAPGRLPGGSSTGSASAAASGACDIAIGSDTGGSIRVPSSFCGLYGIRTTHGRVDLTGAMHMADSFDAAGWFANGPGTFRKVGRRAPGRHLDCGGDLEAGRARRRLCGSRRRCRGISERGAGGDRRRLAEAVASAHRARRSRYLARGLPHHPGARDLERLWRFRRARETEIRTRRRRSLRLRRHRHGGGGGAGAHDSGARPRSHPRHCAAGNASCPSHLAFGRAVRRRAERGA